MNVLFYSTVRNGAGEWLERELEVLVPENKREIHRTIDSLSHKLRQPTSELTIAVLFAASISNLLALLSIRDLLSDVRIILILPDREEDTIAMGHALRPRYLSYIDGNFKDVAAVLKKMILVLDNGNN